MYCQMKAKKITNERKRSLYKKLKNYREELCRSRNITRGLDRDPNQNFFITKKEIKNQVNSPHCFPFIRSKKKQSDFSALHSFVFTIRIKKHVPVHILCSCGEQTILSLLFFLEYFEWKNFTGQLYQTFLVKSVKCPNFSPAVRNHNRI